LVFGSVPHGPLAILKETYCGERELPPGLGKGPVQYLKELREKLQLAKSYAESHAQRAQQQYATRYNRRSRDKHFALHEKVLILKPDSTASRVFSRWRGPAEIVAVKSPYSYVVELDGVKYRLHANYLRRHNVRADEITYDTTAFGRTGATDMKAPVGEPDRNEGARGGRQQPMQVATCAVIHEEDEDFGAVQTVGARQDVGKVDPREETNNCLPSQRIDIEQLKHF
jgi:hypothetical protein